MPRRPPKTNRPIMPCKCGWTTNTDPNMKGLYCWDGRYYRYIRDIPKSDCPTFPAQLMTVSVVSDYVRSNILPSAALPSLLIDVHSAFMSLAEGLGPPATTEKRSPAVSVKKSVTPDYIISLEDGKPYKSLKRHLSSHGMTPADYRLKWGLASDYPMVAPNYAKTRSELAKSSGLGRRRKLVPAAVPIPTATKGRGPSKAK